MRNNRNRTPDVEKILEKLNNRLNKEQDRSYDRNLEWTYKSRNKKRFYEGGVLFPKKIEPPIIYRIQLPEPHAIFTDGYEKEEEWYDMFALIPPYAEQAYLTYKRGFWHACIACCINCCESIVKYEYLRRLPREQANKYYNDKLMFGTLLYKTSCLELLELGEYSKSLKQLNDLRIGLFHFNKKKTSIKLKWSDGREFFYNQITDDMLLPKLALFAYSVMCKLIKKFYSREMAIKYGKEARKDFKRLQKSGKLKNL